VSAALERQGTRTHARVLENNVANVASGVVSDLVGPESGPNASKSPADTETETPPDAATGREAQRIAAELVRFHRAGAVKNEQDTEFYANVIKAFDATYVGSTSPSPDEATLTDEQLVPPPPDGLSAEELAAYYQEDLERAIGEEFIDRDYRPPAKPDRSSTRKKKRKENNADIPRT
jgi:hypothetical protein